MIKDCPICTGIYKRRAYVFDRPLTLKEYLNGCLHNISQIPKTPKTLFEQVMDADDVQRVKDNELIEDGKRFRRLRQIALDMPMCSFQRELLNKMDEL